MILNDSENHERRGQNGKLPAKEFGAPGYDFTPTTCHEIIARLEARQ